MARERISQLDILQTQERSLLKHTAVKIDRLVQTGISRLVAFLLPIVPCQVALVELGRESHIGISNEIHRIVERVVAVNPREVCRQAESLPCGCHTETAGIRRIKRSTQIHQSSLVEIGSNAAVCRSPGIQTGFRIDTAPLLHCPSRERITYAVSLQTVAHISEFKTRFPKIGQLVLVVVESRVEIHEPVFRSVNIVVQRKVDTGVAHTADVTGTTAVTT